MIEQQKIRTRVRQSRIRTSVASAQTVITTDVEPAQISSSTGELVTKIAYTGRPGSPGPAGSDGADGPPGPAGPPGGSYVHHQSVASTTWDILHNLGMVPNWFVLDSAGNEIAGFTVIPIDLNNTRLTFAHAFGGTAYGS